MESTDRRAFVDLIDGFLGAGKTTFIRRYAAYLEAHGISHVILENEFGAAGVDARLLGGNVRELSGGCICCGQKVAFHNLLIELAGEAERIIVEPSGVFNADDFFDILFSPAVRAVARPGMLVGIVDPLSLEGMSAEDERVLISELTPAGAIVFSRADRVGEDALRSAEERLRRLLGGLPEVTDTLRADFSRLMSCGPVWREHERMRADHSTLFQSATLYPEGCYDEAGLKRLAARLLSGEAGGALRVKGVLRAKDGFLSLNAAGRDADVAAADGPAALNIIGRGLNRRQIRCILSEEKTDQAGDL